MKEEVEKLAPLDTSILKYNLLKSTLLGPRNILKGAKLPKRKIHKRLHGTYANIAGVVATLKLTTGLETLALNEPFKKVHKEARDSLCLLTKLNKQVYKSKRIKNSVCTRSDSIELENDEKITFIHQAIQKSLKIVGSLISEWKSCGLKVKKGKSRLRCKSTNGRKNRKRKNRKNRKNKKRNRQQRKRNNTKQQS